MESIAARWRHLRIGLFATLGATISAVLAVVSTATLVADEAGIRRPALIAWLPDWSWTAWAALALAVLFVTFFEGSFRAARRRAVAHTAELEAVRRSLSEAEAALAEARSLPRQAIAASEIKVRTELAELITRIHRHTLGHDKGPLPPEIPARAGLLKDQLAHHPEAAELWKLFMFHVARVNMVRAMRAEKAVTEEIVQSLFDGSDLETRGLTEAMTLYRDWLMMRAVT